jgi:hypothetical protein
MRARYILPVGGLCAIAPLTYLLLPKAVERPDGIGQFTDWKPTTQEIARTVGGSPGGVPTGDQHGKFAMLFQQRFRNKDIAVKIRYLAGDRLQVSCAAVIPRWDMARVTVAAHEEFKLVFGRSVPVDLYETYISLRPRKLGELAQDPKSGRALLAFDPKYAAAETAMHMWTRYPPVTYFSPAFYASGQFWYAPRRPSQMARRRSAPIGRLYRPGPGMTPRGLPPVAM